MGPALIYGKKIQPGRSPCLCEFTKKGEHQRLSHDPGNAGKMKGNNDTFEARGAGESQISAESDDARKDIEKQNSSCNT